LSPYAPATNAPPPTPTRVSKTTWPKIAATASAGFPPKPAVTVVKNAPLLRHHGRICWNAAEVAQTRDLPNPASHT
jgi:hypothetical protein